jgi:hypothetical protein
MNEFIKEWHLKVESDIKNVYNYMTSLPLHLQIKKY